MELRYKPAAGNYTIPTVVPRPRALGRHLGAEHSQRLEAIFPRLLPRIKIVGGEHPHQSAKGLNEGRHPRQQPVALSSMCLTSTPQRGTARG